MGRNIHKFTINPRFEQAVLEVYNAAIEGKGIFHGGYDSWKKRYMPEWRDAPKDAREAAEYLHTSHYFERRIQSRVLHRRLRKLWYNPEKNWIFKSDKVQEHPLDNIAAITRKDIGYTIDNPPERVLYNSGLLLNKYSGDSRNIIQGVTVEEATKRLNEFQGVGDGIASMAILQFMHREIASPLDPENALFKVDVHKGRIPLNVGGIDLSNSDRDIHVEYLTKRFQQEYWRICRKHNLDPIIADSALWVLGSEVCAKRNYRSCQMNCSMMQSGLCLTNVPLTREEQDGVPAGRYLLFNSDGTRAETRRRPHEKHQKHFFL